MHRLSKRLNKIGCILVFLELAIIVFHEGQWSLVQVPSNALADANLDATLVAPQQKPDIYYIVLDACGSDRTFKEQFQCDPQSFTAYLQAKGFVIPQNSHSNYSLTEISLPSFLNMSFLDPLAKALPDRQHVDYSLNNKMIRDCRVARILKHCGYRFINIGSGFGPTAWNPLADENMEGSILNETSLFLLQRSLIGMFDFDFLLSELRKIRLSALENFVTATKEPGPKFVFMHILLPHPPYIFDADGNAVKVATTEAEWSSAGAKSASAYVEQAKFIKARARLLVDRIFAESKVPPIIVIHGDHGPATSGNPDSETNCDSYVRERMSIFNAYYMPGLGKSSVYASITPVNTWRIIFNDYFHGQYPLLPDRSFISSYMHPFQWTEVTKKLQ